jgi:putative oxidoreductase
MSTIAAVIGRILIALLFVVSGVMKLLDPGPAAAMLQAAQLSPALAFPTALFEIVLGLALALGMVTRLAALLLAGFTVLTIVFFHNQFADPAQLPTILLHVALVGGLLGVFAHSQIWWSLDALRRRRREELAAQDADARAHGAELRAERAEGHAEAHDGAVAAGAAPAAVPPRRRWF